MSSKFTIADLAGEAGLPVEQVLQLCRSLDIFAVSGKSCLISAVADRLRRHLVACVLVRASDAAIHAVFSHAEVLEVVTRKKADDLSRRGIGQAELPAVSAVALDASANVERDDEHGERRLRVSLPTAGGQCVVILSQHRRSGALVVVTAFHDARSDGHCRREFLNAAKTLETFVSPAARLALLSC